MSVCFAPCPVVFDLDGTLIDSAPDIHACVNAALREHHLPLLTLDQVRSFVGGGVDMLWNKIIGALGIDHTAKNELVATFMARYHHATQLTRVFPGVIDALNALADRGYSLGICTNKPEAVTNTILEHFGIQHLFGVVIGGDTLPQRKPDPAPLIAALTALGADPVRPHGLFVGDSEFDANCAAAVPVPLLLYAKGYRHTPLEDLPHRAQFAEFEALPALVESISLV